MTVYELPGPRRRSQLSQSGSLYGLHVPYDKGYDAQSRRNARRAEDHDSSGNFYSPALNAQIELWLTDITADFSVSGSTGQSRMLREFFPRSFNDVTLQITGNVSSTQEYNRLAGFIRESHWKALHNISAGQSADQAIRFTLYDKTPPHWAPHRRAGEESSGTSQANVKGAHRPWVVNGYVQSVAAGAVRWEVAPEFTIAFVVTESQLTGNTGLWGDQADTGGSTLQTWLQLLNVANASKRVQGPGFIQDPLAPPAPPAKPKGARQQVQQAVDQASVMANAALKFFGSW